MSKDSSLILFGALININKVSLPFLKVSSDREERKEEGRRLVGEEIRKSTLPSQILPLK
jgi:hypothetical protein